MTFLLGSKILFIQEDRISVLFFTFIFCLQNKRLCLNYLQRDPCDFSFSFEYHEHMDFYSFAVIILFDVQVAPDISQWEPHTLASVSFRLPGAPECPRLLFCNQPFL